MKKRWLTLFMSAVFAFGGMTGNVYAQNTSVKIQTVFTPEQMTEVLNYQNASVKSGKSRKSIKKQAVDSRLIVNSQEAPENVYGAKKVYYYTFGRFYVLEYVSAAQAELAQKQLAKQYEEEEVFVDQMITLQDTRANASTTSTFDGIQAMGLDVLKQQAEGTEWNDKNTVTVAVIDTGIDVDHPWFAGRIDEKTSINMATDKDYTDYNDETGHGTHVSGIVVKGTTDKVKIMAVRIFDAAESASVLTLRLGVDYATTHGADVMNLSLGYDTEELASNLGSEELSFIDDSFEVAADRGVTICVASGNEYTNVSRSYPASSGWTIAVGSIEQSATDPKEYVHSGFSNTGALLDFCAPGGKIESAWIDGGTEVEDGTSMAAPHLAAAAAMIKLKNPEYTQWDVYATMRDYAVDLGPEGKDDDYGYGYVNLSEYAKDGTDPSKKYYQAIYVDTALNTNIVNKGKTYDLGVQLTKGDGVLSYKTTNEKVATVDNKGIVTIEGGGTCNIEITASETEAYKETSKSVTVKVSKGEQTITIPQSTYTKYEGDPAFQLEASVDKPGDGKLTFLANKNSVIRVTEEGYVTILGTGKVEVYPVANATASYKRYVGDPITIEVKKASERPTEEKRNETDNKDERNTEAGSIQGEQKPATSIQETRAAKTEEASKQNVTAPAKVKKVKVKAGKKQVKVTWKKQSGMTGYQIRYSSEKAMKRSVMKKVKGGHTYTIKKLTSGKIYYVQVRAYRQATEKTVYGSWSTKVKIAAK